MLKSNKIVFTLTAALAAMVLPHGARASEWDGAAGTWSSNTSPGWNGTGVPNAVGAVADHAVAVTTNATTQDVTGGVTVGTISLTNNSANFWTITPTNAIIMNQDGAGAGTATISNTNTTVSTANDLSIGTGTLTLADDLLISNTGASTYTSGSIIITAAIGGTGNITLYNAGSNDPTAGYLRIGTATNTFTGNVLVQKGATTFNVAGSFGSATTNTITLGQAGQGSATLVSTAGVTTPNNIVVAAGSGGTLTLGTTSTSNPGFSGTVTLNDNLTVTSASTNATGMLMSGVISGTGGITKVGAGILRMTNVNNSFAGGTTINAGTIIAGANGVFSTGGVTLAASTTLTLNATVTNAIADAATLTLGGVAPTAGKLNLLAATGTAQETVGNLVLNGVTQAAGTYGNTGSGATNILPDYFSGTGILTVVGASAVPEPSTYAAFAAGLLALIGIQRVRRRRA